MIDKANQLANRIAILKTRERGKNSGKSLVMLWPDERDLVIDALHEYVERRRTSAPGSLAQPVGPGP